MIEKKLSKRLVETAPSLFGKVWIDRDVSEKADSQGSSVSHVLMVGGGHDYWGEAEEAYTVWEWWRLNWYWVGNFQTYQDPGHPQYMYPDTEGFKETTQSLLKLARGCHAKRKV